jgi:hypothetical protein
MLAPVIRSIRVIRSSASAFLHLYFLVAGEVVTAA